MKVVPATPDNIQRAAEHIKAGELIVVPTETVYGLAADALNPEAIRKVFAAKGRPSENPLIVHVSGPAQLSLVASEVPPLVQGLADRFWPRPLTLVLPKRSEVPSETTAGLDTVAVRVPNHSVALAILELVGPFAAPSANPFMAVSPTRIEHLDPRLLDHVALVLDAGRCEVGIESTVLDLTQEPPVVLRPGGVSLAVIQEVAPGTRMGTAPVGTSPGMYPRHYAPKTALRLVDKISHEAAGLTFGEPSNERQFQMPRSPDVYAARLYGTLHRLDELNVGSAEVELPPDEPEWAAVLDRLRKGSTS